MRVLIIGAGSPANQDLFQCLGEGCDCFVADDEAEPRGQGWCPPRDSSRMTLRREAFYDALYTSVTRWKIDVVVPTLDEALLPLARRRTKLEACGTCVLAPSEHTLGRCRDLEALALVGDGHEPDGPSTGYGLSAVLRDEPITVDVALDGRHRVIAAVPRVCLQPDAPQAVAWQTFKHDVIQALASRVAQELGLVGVVSVGLRRTPGGHLYPAAVWPRFTQGMTATVRSGVDLPMLAFAILQGLEVDPIPWRETTTMMLYQGVRSVSV